MGGCRYSIDLSCGYSTKFDSWHRLTLTAPSHRAKLIFARLVDRRPAWPIPPLRFDEARDLIHCLI
jgi:hypothetical protein